MKKVILCLSVLLMLFNIESSAYVRYVTANLNLRSGPGMGYKIITIIPVGTAVTIEEDCDCKWIPVEYHGLIGFISTKFLSGKPKNRGVNKDSRAQTGKHRLYSSPRNGIRHYTNVDGYRVQSPTYYSSVPAGATALCRDGTYSFSLNRRGTCSRHGGVARWL